MKPRSSYQRLWSWLVLLLLAIANGHAGDLADFKVPPPEARPGECYAKVIVPARYNETRHTIVNREASEVINIVPATYEWVDESVVVVDATETFEVIPETYRWIEERVLVEPESFSIEPVAAEYESITEQILDAPEQISWSNQCGPLQSVEHMTGDILCLVSEPATYKTITRQVVSKPATTRRVVRPPIYKTVRKQVLDTPARIVRTPLPAQYEKIRVRKLVSPARVERTLTPTEYQSITTKERVFDDYFAWYPVICDTSLDKSRVTELQRALKKSGYYRGEVDGVLGVASLAAVDAFQLNSRLARGALTIETFAALGVDH